MKRITRDQSRKYAFDWEDEPLLRVLPGESFEIETWDASTGYFRTPGRQGHSKPTGPDSTETLRWPTPSADRSGWRGAEPGDLLEVSIEAITVADYSWTAVGPNRGPLGTSTRWPELSSQYTTKIFRHAPGPSGTTRDGTLPFQPTDPVAHHPLCRDHGGWRPTGRSPPAGTARAPGAATWTSATWPPENKVYLPIFHPGARFYLGDVHASQGDTEFTGTAAGDQCHRATEPGVGKGKDHPLYADCKSPARS